MKESSFRSELQAAILAKEQLREEARLELLTYAKQSLDQVNPIQLLKSAVAGHYKTHTVSGDLLGMAMSLSAGYVSKIVLQGGSHHPLRKFLGTAMMLGVTGLSSLNMDKIREKGNGYFMQIRDWFKTAESKV